MRDRILRSTTMVAIATAACAGIAASITPISAQAPADVFDLVQQQSAFQQVAPYCFNSVNLAPTLNAIPNPAAVLENTIVVNSVTHDSSFTPPSYLFLNGCTNYGANISVSVESNSC